MKKLSFAVSVLIFREANRWVAQGLEYDIAAQADSIPAVKKAFFRAFFSQAAVNVENGKEPLEDVPEAPAFYRDEFKKAERLADSPEFKIKKPVAGVKAVKVKDMRIAA